MSHYWKIFFLKKNYCTIIRVNMGMLLHIYGYGVIQRFYKTFTKAKRSQFDPPPSGFQQSAMVFSVFPCLL